jgi:hypothetical protein
MKLLKVKRVLSASLGELPLNAGGNTFKPSSYKRETKEAETHENIGYTETPTAAELKVSLQATMDPSKFTDLANDTLTVFIDGGGQHVMPNAWATDAVELGDGEMSVTFNCGKSQKV